jgi:hypothetical protein
MSLRHLGANRIYAPKETPGEFGRNFIFLLEHVIYIKDDSRMTKKASPLVSLGVNYKIKTEMIDL